MGELRNKYLDTGLFVTWNNIDTSPWLRMKGTNLVYNFKTTYRSKLKWFVFNEHNDKQVMVVRRMAGHPIMPNNFYDVDSIFTSMKKFFPKDNDAERKDYYIEEASEDILDVLLTTLPPDLQAKLIFNIDLFK